MLRLSSHYMHDNHTFTRLSGSLDDIIAKARSLAKESTYGALCPIIVLDESRELRRVGGLVHAQRDVFLEHEMIKWRDAILADSDIMQILHPGRLPDNQDPGDEQPHHEQSGITYVIDQDPGDE